MLKHYKGTSGYSYLYLFIFFPAVFLTLFLFGLSKVLGMSQGNGIVGGVIFAIFWIAGYVITQRFIHVEKRRPTISEANIISIKNFAHVIGLMLVLGILALLIAIVVGGGGGGEEARPKGDDDQATQLIRMVWGVMAMLFTIYLAPFINLAIISRFMQSNAPGEHS